MKHALTDLSSLMILPAINAFQSQAGMNYKLVIMFKVMPEDESAGYAAILPIATDARAVLLNVKFQNIDGDELLSKDFDVELPANSNSSSLLIINIPKIFSVGEDFVLTVVYTVSDTFKSPFLIGLNPRIASREEQDRVVVIDSDAWR